MSGVFAAVAVMAPFSNSSGNVCGDQGRSTPPRRNVLNGTHETLIGKRVPSACTAAERPVGAILAPLDLAILGVNLAEDAVALVSR